MQRLQQLVDRLREGTRILDILNEGLALYRLDGTVAFANAAGRRIIGWQPSDSRAPLHYSQHIPANVLAHVDAQFAAVVDFDRHAEFETTFRHRDGSGVDVTVRLLRALFDDELVGVYGIATDISTQKMVESALLSSQQQFRSLFEHHPDSITMMKADGKYSRLNRSAEILTGYFSEELVGKTSNVVLLPDRQPDFDLVRSAVRAGESVSFETKIAHKDGHLIEIEGTAIPIMIDGQADGYYSVTRDVTEVRRVAAAFDRQARRINALYQVASSVGASPDQQIDRALLLGVQALGYDRVIVTKIDGDRFTIVHAAGEGPAPGHSGPAASTVSERAIAHGDVLFVENLDEAPWSVADEGRPAWGSYLAIPITADGVPYGALAFESQAVMGAPDETDLDFVRAIAALTTAAIDRKIQGARLDRLAFFDALTGLPNRVLFADRVEQALTNSRRHDRAFAIHFIDFDYFKEINDTYGHAFGDEFLEIVAKRLATGLRASDTLARFGGDEFVVLQPEIGSSQHALETAERLLALAREPFRVRDHAFEITISIGISVFPDDGIDADTLLRKADAALYRVKERGRNGVLLHDAAMVRSGIHS